MFADVINSMKEEQNQNEEEGINSIIEIRQVLQSMRLETESPNNANITTMVTSCYTIDEAGKNMYAHSKIVIPLVEGIPNRNQYIAAAFDDFFAARHMVDAEMAKSRNE